MKTLPIQFLRECLHYDPQSGVMTWAHRPRHHFKTDRGWRTFNSQHAGKAAGTISATTGYLIVNFSGSLFSGHRVAWALHHGQWPEKHIDHIDCNRAKNAITNLRLCERSDNQANRGVQSNNTSGLKGAHRHGDGVWRSRIKRGQKTIDLGLFPSPEAAHAAYCAAVGEMHGEFARVQ
mgnify:CR=1 FL=1